MDQVRFINLLLFILLFIIVLFFFYSKIQFKFSVAILFLFIITFMCGLRTFGYDFDTYQHIYISYELKEPYRILEPLSMAIASLSIYMNTGYWGFLSLYSIASAIVLLCAVMLLPKGYLTNNDKGMFLFVYILLFFASGNMTSIRGSLASLFILMSMIIYYRQYKIFSGVSFILALLSHYSSIILCPILFMPKCKKNIFRYGFVFIVILYIILHVVIDIIPYIPIKEPLIQSNLSRLSIYLSRNRYEVMNSAGLVLLLRNYMTAFCGACILFELWKRKEFSKMEYGLFSIALSSDLIFITTLCNGNVELGSRIYELFFPCILPLIIKFMSNRIKLYILFLGGINIGYVYMGYLSSILHYG